MNVENVKSQMRKGMLEYCILLLLQHQPAYTSDIISKLKDADLLVVEGTLYLLKYEWQESTQGPPRKYYALTDLGGQLLLELDKAWGEIANTVSLLKQM